MLIRFVVALVAIELIVRVIRRLTTGKRVTELWPMLEQRSLSFMSHPYALYVKRPNVRGGRYPTNSLGYTGTREVSTVCNPRSVRIYCVGGSTMEGIDPAQGPDSSWPSKLEDILSARLPGVRIECINAGTAGYTSAESLAEFLFRGIDLQPDVLVVYHNVNDAWTCQMVDGFKTDYSHARRHKPWTPVWTSRLPQLPWWGAYQLVRNVLSCWWVNRLPQDINDPGWYRSVRNWLMRYFGQADGLLYCVSDPPWRSPQAFDPRFTYAFERNITNLVSAALTWGCTPVLVKWECHWPSRFLPYYLERNERIIDLYYQCLHANNAVLARIATTFKGCQYLEVGPFEAEHFYDTIHFTASGLREMTRRVADGIEPLVKAIAQSRDAGGADRTATQASTMDVEEAAQ